MGGGKQDAGPQRTPLARLAIGADGSVTPARVVRTALFADAGTLDAADTQARGRTPSSFISSRVVQPTLQAPSIAILGLGNEHRKKATYAVVFAVVFR